MPTMPPERQIIVLKVRTSALLVKPLALLGVSPLVRDLGGVDEQRPAVVGAPAPDLDGLQPVQRQGRPGLLQREGMVAHGSPSGGRNHAFMVADLRQAAPGAARRPPPAAARLAGGADRRGRAAPPGRRARPATGPRRR